MAYRNLLYHLFLTLLLVGFFGGEATAADPKRGMQLFTENGCGSCHAGNMKDRSTGPALYGAQKRWKDAGADIYAWINNNVALRGKGIPYVDALLKEYNNSPMNLYPNLTKADIDDILLYIENKATFGDFSKEAADAKKATAGADDKKGGAKKEEGTNYTLWILFFTLLGGVAMLGRYVHQLNRLAQQRTGEAVEAPKSVLRIIFSPAVVRLTIFGLIILGGYTTVNNAIGLSRQQGYAPDQPIKFSHALHAGKHKIDCQYCHDGARRSKHGSIPAVNTCINCHAVVQNGPEYGTAEILKIYAAANFDPRKKAYFPAGVDDSTRMAEYAKYLNEKMEAELTKGGGAKANAEKAISSQLAAIKHMLNKPIEWIRIHNLPDHAYFNHAQHVVAGKQECQTCHGKVEEMEVVKQHSPLSMGWCVNCHRQTKVNFENPYYANKAEGYTSYEVYHKELKDNKRKGVTVEEIGGLECQKCHY